MSLTLYGVPTSRAARCLWMLEELETPYTHVQTNYATGQTRAPEFLEINPNGHIPALVDGDTVVWESLAINLYLARRFGGPLAPADLKQEAAALQWSFWAMTECESPALAIIMHRVALPAEQRKAGAAEAGEKALAGRYDVLEGALAGREYLAADHFTVADLNVASVLAWAAPAAGLQAERPHVKAWLARCLGRPAHRKVQAMMMRPKS